MIVSFLGLLLVAVYVVSRVLTDQFAWSQWLWWAPAEWWVACAWIACGFSFVLSGLAWSRGARSTRGAGVFWIYLLVCIGMLVHLVIGVWRIPNAIGGYGIHWTHTQGCVRVMHWNIAAGHFDEEQASNWIADSNIDLLLLANTRFDGQRQEMMNGLRSRLGDDVIVRSLPRALVVSRYNIVKTQLIYVSASGEEGPTDEAMRATGDFGWIAILTLDSEDEFGVFDVWLVDLPSEPTVHRMESMARAVERIQERISNERSTPALIIGDFNTVCGSASLRAFDTFSDAGFEDAFATRGAGSGSWRPTAKRQISDWITQRSSWGIDLSLVGNGWRTEGYQLLLPDGATWGEGISHRAQVIDIEPAE